MGQEFLTISIGLMIQQYNFTIFATLLSLIALVASQQGVSYEGYKCKKYKPDDAANGQFHMVWHNKSLNGWQKEDPGVCSLISDTRLSRSVSHLIRHRGII